MSFNTNCENAEAANGRFMAGVMACLPTMPGYWSIGMAAGAIGTLSGFSLLHTTLLAAGLYAGSAHFLFYSLWAAGAESASVILSVALVNMRYLLMSSALSIWFRHSTALQKLIGGVLLTDETFGVAVQHATRQGALPFPWLLGLNISAWLNWIVACVVGAWLATALPPFLMEGLSFSLVSMFVGLLVMTWYASQRKLPETVAIFAAILITLTTASHLGTHLVVIIAAMLSATVATCVLRMRSKREK
ncbi:AzlC family ABC transporter permease [Yokenella regensburgei]|uniref:AzlC family ABC transporter permease n=1 Tax=Yokenella regensburgei TaxID=158877 RepID=UPI003F16A1D9